MVDSQPPAAKPRSPIRTAVGVLVSLVLVGAIFYFLLRDIDLQLVWAEIRAMTWMEDAVLALIAAWNLATYAFVWMSVTPGLSFWHAFVMTQATTAVANTVYGGSAIGIGMTYSMLGKWGYSRSRTTTAVLVSGVWNSFVKLGLPVLALALVADPGRCRRRPGHRGAAGHRRAGRRHRGVRPDPAQRGPGAPVRAAGRPGHLPAAAAGPPAARARLGAGHGQVPQPHPGAGRAPLGPDHGGHAGQSPVAVPGAAGYSSRGRGERRRGRLGGGAGGVRLRAAGHRDPVHAWRRRGGRGGADRRAGGGGWRPGAGDRRGAGVPGADLGVADPGRGRLLPVVAPGLNPAGTRHGRRPAAGRPPP